MTLHQRLHDEGSWEVVFKALRKLLEGKPIPGYRWRSLVERQQRQKLWRRGSISMFVLLLFILILVLGLRWYPNETNLIAIFVTVMIGGIQAGLWLKPFLEWWRGKSV